MIARPLIFLFGQPWWTKISVSICHDTSKMTAWLSATFDGIGFSVSFRRDSTASTFRHFRWLRIVSFLPPRLLHHRRGYLATFGGPTFFVSFCQFGPRSRYSATFGGLSFFVSLRYGSLVFDLALVIEDSRFPSKVTVRPPATFGGIGF